MLSRDHEQAQDPARRSVRPGDSVYYHGPGGVGHAPVLCAGKHGVTLDIAGQPTAVRWQHVLGHRERVGYPARIVDAGEDGAIVEEDDGTRAYIEGLAEPEPEPETELETAWGSLMKSETAYLFFVKATGASVANRPGLSLRAVSDKRGHQIKRWKRTSEEPQKQRPAAAAKPGSAVRFDGGVGHVVASGADGITVQDQAGKEHQVRHGDYRPHGSGAETSGKSAPKRPEWAPREVVDAAEAKRMKDAEAEKDAAKAKQATGQPRKFFDPAEVEQLPHKDNVKQEVFHDWASASALAPAAHKEYTDLLNSLGQSLGFAPGRGAPDAMNDEDLESDQAFIFMGPIKQEGKSTAKVNNDYHGDWTKLKDLVRATISVKSIGDVHSALDGLKKVGLTFAQKPKDNMTHGMVEGYRDLNLILKLPQSKMLVELQIAVKQISKVKGECHEFYNANILLNEKRKQAIRAGGQSVGAMRVGEPIGGYDANNPYDERNWPDKADWKAFSHNVKRQQVIYHGAWAKVPGLDLIAKALRQMILFLRRTLP